MTRCPMALLSLCRRQTEWTKATETQGHQYGDSRNCFTANLLIHEVHEENFLYADEEMEEYRGLYQ